MASCRPNAAHHALARLEKEWDKVGGFLLITQNIDDLHWRAGSKNVLQMHGDIRKIRCETCGHQQDSTEDCFPSTECSGCGQQGKMRPHVVWFGEFPLYLQEIETVLDHTDILVVIGTSGSVMPASLFPQFVNQNGRNPQVIEVNPSPTNDPAFTKVVKGYAVSAVPKLVEDILISHDAVSRQISSSVMVSQV